ncbi:MAG: glycosyltransferase [Oscillospiraceae bacterium]|nr:glycosyltransferase [Oscillospiraceae bacterium]MCL2278973.1 glycosyltransferase [Oscillospiraceae bacterium]
MISQCMIVKNEEKNIERALTWGREIMSEQIVVDTGSSDCTVEKAKSMGAKVYSFKWTNDFSAAKNFAIEQAKGEWIVFLDADEYMSPDSVKNLQTVIKKVKTTPQLSEKVLAITCDLVNVDDNDRPQSVYDIIRVIKNVPCIRYAGIIHEQIEVDAENIMRSDDLEVIHTGYSVSAIAETNKHERNIKLLREALKEKPDDLTLKAYLADSLKHKEDEESQREAEEYFREVIENSANSVFYRLRIKAYVHFLNKYVNDKNKRKECEELALKALSEYPSNVDFEYFLASVYNYQGKHKKAWDLLKDCEERLANNGEIGDSAYVSADMTTLYGQLILAAQGLSDTENVIHFALQTLRHDKTRMDILTPLIVNIIKGGKSEDELIKSLESVYNFNDPRDLLIIAKAAKTCGATELAIKIVKIAEAVMNPNT